MSEKKQISIRGETYDKIKAYCEKQGLSVAKFVDDLCSDHFTRESEQKKDKGNGNGGKKTEAKKTEPVSASGIDHRKTRW
jgi:hypothetical protein